MTKIIIDVREPEEYAEAHAKGAINIPSTELLASNADLSKLNKSDEIITYCRTGVRAGSCKQYLNSNGFTNVINGINQVTIESGA